MRVERMRKTASVLFVLLALAVTGSVAPAHAKDKDYKALIEETGGYLNEALAIYKKGDVPGAKKKAQAAYFEVYENLEGPIRVNVSAKKNIELEDEFVAIRKMIVAKEPAAAVEKSINTFMTQLRAVAPELEGGVELVAEKDGKARETASVAKEESASVGKVEPAWREAYENIQAGLGSALDVYKKGDAKKAAELVVQTHFDHYKSSLLETAVRRSVSQKKNFENNAGFSEIEEMIGSGKPAASVEARIASLVGAVKEDLPGLALVDGAVAKNEGKKSAETTVADKDWNKVTADLFQEIDKAQALYKSGDVRGAVMLMQDAYFDIFEASGMEAKIGARDADFKASLEGRFSMIAGRMKKGASAAEMAGLLGAVRADFDKAAAMLGKGQDSPLALFFYSLMIILREGIEAILIITAIIAYLVKSGNQDKVRVIYNGCSTALVLSGITAVLVKWVFKTSASSQEVMEGGTMLIASLVLFSVSYWLISKAEAQKWVSYIQDKVGGSLTSNSLRALWFAAFLAVYREGAETVLFYQALASDSAGSGLTAVAGGFLTGSVLLVVIYLAMRYGAMRLPLRKFFLCTGALLYYMAFVFAGKGVMELISGKVFEPALVSWMPTIPWVGLYPYAQTLIPQLVILLAAVAGIALMVKQRTASDDNTAS